jgi:hypothetical protein
MIKNFKAVFLVSICFIPIIFGVACLIIYDVFESVFCAIFFSLPVSVLIFTAIFILLTMFEWFLPGGSTPQRYHCRHFWRQTLKKSEDRDINCSSCGSSFQVCNRCCEIRCVKCK